MKLRLIAAVIVLIVGAFLPMSPATTWSSGEQVTGAPAATPGPDSLIDARRATGEAGAQTGFLTQGTTQLKDGSVALRDGLDELAGGADTAQQGAQELSNGMNALSGGLAELGSGANQVADGVGTAVNAVVGFEAIKGQVIGAIDRAVADTEGVQDPEVQAARQSLTDLRGQVEVAQLPEDIVTQLNQLRDGSRELANQLATPGYPFFDGMYQATTGSTELANGLAQLRDGVTTARDGSQELADGATQVDTIATNTGDKIDTVRRAIPGPTPQAAGAAETTAAAEEEEAVTSALSPLVAMLIAALMVLGGLALALAAYAAPGSRWSIAGFGAAFLTVIGLILVMVLGAGLTPVAMLLFAAALFTAVAAATGVTWLVLNVFGPRIGAGIAAAFAAIQVGVVGWVWKTASVGTVAAAWEHVAAFMPLHWTTTVVSAAGNHGNQQAMWIALALSVVLAVLGVEALRSREAAPAVQPAPAAPTAPSA
ncbi:hypothetical protein [Corynebacterium lubricantis]|uniref:hypothetical protein n=1 Tax=Corynebacterium lubricantis TaxID=541095 RepID=UPI000376A266|nr:hypothetical protein [Corynebacterium lubricantis]